DCIQTHSIVGSCTHYQAYTLLLAAGQDVIEKGLDAGTPNERNMYEVIEEALRREGIAVLPSTLKDAADALEADEVIRAALGDEYAQTYITAKRAEWEEYHNVVSQWEIDHYVDLY